MSTAARTIDLNADMGESYGRWVLGDDAGVMNHVCTVNIATERTLVRSVARTIRGFPE